MLRWATTVWVLDAVATDFQGSSVYFSDTVREASSV